MTTCTRPTKNSTSRISIVGSSRSAYFSRSSLDRKSKAFDRKVRGARRKGREGRDPSTKLDGADHGQQKGAPYEGVANCVFAFFIFCILCSSQTLRLLS